MVTIIAEAGINHDGKGHKACRLADAAKAAGADIVKFQTFNPDHVFRAGPAREKAWSWVLNLHDLRMVVAHCHNIGIEFCSTPDDLDSLKWLVEEAGVKRIKLGSGSLLYEPLVDAAFDTGLPVLLSTGMATLDEVRQVVVRQRRRWLRDQKKGGLSHLTLMHCVSLYPCPDHLANVGAINEMDICLSPQWPADLFAIGYSDHTMGAGAGFAAVALGATVIEKHLTLDRDADGPDHRMSMIPIEFELLVRGVRATEVLMGTGFKQPSDEERPMIPRLRKDKDGFQPGL